MTCIYFWYYLSYKNYPHVCRTQGPLGETAAGESGQSVASRHPLNGGRRSIERSRFDCDRCSTAFKRQGALRKHIDLVQKGKRYFCRQYKENLKNV